MRSGRGRYGNLAIPSMPSPAAPLLFAGPALALSLSLSVSAGAQSHPFPASGHYAQGYLPSSATAAAAQASYANWKSKYLKDDCGSGYYRVDNGSGNASTFSEGQGYGMVLTAYFGDRTEFDGLWAFAKKNYNTKGLMGWHVTCSGATTSDGGSGSATDGDTDIGFGLLVASAQWGGRYGADAMTYLSTLKTVDFTTCSPTGRNIPTAGSWQGSAACTTSGGSNTSYWMPGYYRVFASFTGDGFWSKAADDVVALYGLAANSSTGIIVNEVDQTGAGLSGQTYDYNSCRIPWRAALDYLWFGTPAVRTAMTKMTAWASSVGIGKIVDGYNADGTATGRYTGLNEWVGGFTVGATTDSQAIVDAFATDFVGIADDNGGYYGSSLRTLYLLTLSGNQWNPMAALADGGAPSPGGSGDGGGSPAGPDAGSSTGGEAGVTPPTADASTGGAGADGGPPTAGVAGSSGCGCVVAERRPSIPGATALAFVVGAALRRRRRH